MTRRWRSRSTSAALATSNSPASDDPRRRGIRRALEEILPSAKFGDERTILAGTGQSALGLVVAILDLIPLAGATIAAIIITAVAFLESTTAGFVVLGFFLVYQQIENHFLLPIVYSRTVQLSPLAILISVLIGAKLAGILGALAAIPVAGTIQVLLLAWLRERREREPAEPTAA